MGPLTLRVGLLVTIVSAIAMHSAHAQTDTWKNVAPPGGFHKSIGCGYFFNKDHGLIGSGVRPGEYYDQTLNLLLPVPEDTVSIYKTTDGGQSWVTTVLPKRINGAVTCIHMEDTLNGYASIFSTISYDLYGNFGNSALWRTSDGGSTWVDELHIDHDLTSVYSQPGLLLYTKWDRMMINSHYAAVDTFGGAYSFDSGRTWKTDFRVGDGIAFSDSLNGIVTELNQDYGMNFWRTSDAGRTWGATAEEFESWSIYAVPGTQMYFCANESQSYLPHQNVTWSTDGGATWQTRMRFPNIRFTGTIAGKANTLYVQTDSTNDATYAHGLYRSDDLGATWHWVGGPSHSRDTRFVVTGCMGEVVYAFDAYGNVWKTEDGGDGTMPGADAIAMSADSITWLPNPCGDTMSYKIVCATCIPITIDSFAQVSGTELIPTQNGSFPTQLSERDSTHLSLIYSPTGSGVSRSVIRVYAHAGLDRFVRDLTIDIRASVPRGIMFSKDTFALQANGCSSVEDTVQFLNLGCPGLVLDSVALPRGEVFVLNSFPDSISNAVAYPLRLTFAPDSAGTHQLVAHLFAHNGRRQIDTVISITARSTMVLPSFVLDSTALAFTTSYCMPRQSSLRLASTGCDSLMIDSLLVSNAAFVMTHVPSAIAARNRDSLALEFSPDSLGAISGTVRLFAHTRLHTIDTTIIVTGVNRGLPQALTMSRTSVLLATKACLAAQDTLTLTNQCCEKLYLDSILVPGSELVVTCDSSRLPLASNDSLPLHFQFIPSDGLSKSFPVRLLMHTSRRIIDTTILVTTSNAIPPNPLSLSSDSLSLWTKYCQPVTLPITIANFGCAAMSVDSAIVEGDLLHEFRIVGLDSTIDLQDSISASVQFWPDGSGSRTAHLRLFTHGGKAIDTLLSLRGKNLIAPEPYIPPLPTLSAGKILRIPIMLRPTADTFTIQSFSAHLRLNTDLLTPFSLDFTNTCARHVKASSLTLEPGIGASIRIELLDTISDTSQLSLPLVYVLDSVRIAPDTETMVTLDKFATDREPTLALCSIPSQPFVLAMPCGDRLLWEYMSSASFSFSISSVTPNPASNEASWKVLLDVRQPQPDLAIDLYDARGEAISHTKCAQMTEGQFTVPVALPTAEGDYFIVARGSGGAAVKKVTVKR